MSFDLREAGIYSGSPVELWWFNYKGADYRYTSADVMQSYAGNLYIPTTLTRTSWQRSEEREQAGSVQFYVPLEHEVAQFFTGAVLWNPVSVVVYYGHEGDADADFQTAFIGEISDCQLRGRGEVELTARNLEGQMGMRLPRQLFSVQCANMLGDEGCQVDLEAFAWDATVAAVSGNTVTITGLDAHVGTDKAFHVNGTIKKNGFVVAPIEIQDGDVLRCLSPVDGLLAVGDVVRLYPGCDHQIGTCKARFQNAINYLGHIMVPTFNPFDGLRGLRTD